MGTFRTEPESGKIVFKSFLLLNRSFLDTFSFTFFYFATVSTRNKVDKIATVGY